MQPNLTDLLFVYEQDQITFSKKYPVCKIALRMEIKEIEINTLYMYIDIVYDVWISSKSDFIC